MWGIRPLVWLKLVLHWWIWPFLSFLSSGKATDSVCSRKKQTQKRSPDVEMHTDPNTLSQELVFNKLPVGVGWEGISSFWNNSDNLQMCAWRYLCMCVCVCVCLCICRKRCPVLHVSLSLIWLKRKDNKLSKATISWKYPIDLTLTHNYLFICDSQERGRFKLLFPRHRSWIWHVVYSR